MNLQKKMIASLIALVAISLVGLVSLQYILITNAIELKQQAFRQNVNAAMNTIVQNLETGEAVGNVFRVAIKDPSMKHRDQGYSYLADSTLSVSVTSTDSFSRVLVTHDAGKFRSISSDHPPIRWEGQRILYTVNSPQRVLIRAFNKATGKDTVIVNALQQPGEHSVELGDTTMARGEFTFKFVSDSLTSTLDLQNGKMLTALPNKQSVGRREELVGRVIDKLFYAEQVPIEKRLNRSILDSVIGKSLRESGIDLPFAFGVVSERNDSLQIAQPASYAGELQSSGFKARLFPSDMFLSFNQLALYFPGQQVFMLKQVGPLLALTVLFMSIIVFCSAYTLRTIIRQKQFSIRLMDFINNMTHEFKTPISTVAVATETMMHPEVIHNEEKLKRYGMVIHDENLRMKHQVDKILQMAVLEEGTYNLKRTALDIHEVVTKAAENTALLIEARGGTVGCSLEADSSMVDADVVHLTNVINNLLDNAVKYSPDPPEISLETCNVDGKIQIRITDRGLGISEDDQRHVFEKYFRVHTGNMHDVKGFGLGLSYVKLITEAHGGNITLKSEPGKGTAVELTFPVIATA